MKIELLDKICQYGFKRLLLAVSGGLDSICLAHFFIRNKEALGIEWLGIAHVHHGLRAGTADRDAEFVEKFAKSHNVPFFLRKLDGEALNSAEGSLEENAREARYKTLFEIAQDYSEPQEDTFHTPHHPLVIVTAHHAGDQAETLLMRLQRGTTLAGLRGIQEVRSNFVYRPFLNITRPELLAYARENKLEWCEDESNSDVKFARNKVRHKMLPKLEQESPGATEQLCRIAGLANRAYGKVLDTCETVFAGAMQGRNDKAHTSITIDKKKLRKVLLAHENTDLSEMFRLWLSEKGLRFPIGFFYGPKEPAHLKIPHQAVYRKRAITKIGRTLQICEFSTPEEALNFVSCDKKDKGL